MVDTNQAVGRKGPRRTQVQGHTGQDLLPTAHSRQELKQRIRVAEHPLEVYLLFAVGTRLLLSHNAPAADAEFVESEDHWSRGMVGSQALQPHARLPGAHALALEKGSNPGFTS